MRLRPRSEAAIEREAVEYATRTGWTVFKLAGPGNRGKPDRLFLKHGRALFIEFKAPGKKPTALQMAWLKRLVEGPRCVAVWASSVEYAVAVLDSAAKHFAAEAGIFAREVVALRAAAEQLGPDPEGTVH